jgi:hypothetical protein
MSFKAVTRGGRLFYVPGALAVPQEQGFDARVAQVEGDTSKIVFVRSWEEVPLPEPQVVVALPEPERTIEVLPALVFNPPRSERRKADRG